MPKRPAPSSEPKAGAAKRTKQSAAPKAKSGLLATAQSALETVQTTLGDVGAAVEAAGDLMLDAPASAPVSKGAAKGKGKKGKKAPVDEITKENMTGVVDAATQLVRDAGEAAAPYVTAISDAVAPILNSAEQAVEGAIEPVVQKGKQALKKGKKAVAETPAVDAAVKKGKKVVEEAEPVVKETIKKGKKAAAQAEPLVEEVTKKGKKAAAVVEETAKDTVKKGKKVAADAEPVVKDVVKKGKKAAADAEPVVKEAAKKGKKAVAEAETEVVKKGKKAVAAAEPVAKDAVKKGKKAVAEAEPAVKETVKKGKKAAAPVADAVANPKKRKTAADYMSDAEEAVKDKVEVVMPASKRSKPTPKGKGKEAESEEDEDAEFIHGFSSSDGGADSSDDESDSDSEEVAKASGPTVSSQLPPAKDDKSIQDKLAKARKKKDNQKGTLYLSRIPHGFYEDEMKAYFEQFGDVTRLRLARNRKTGASKHYAYIEMSSQSVAQIVAETMNNYLLNGHILKCSVIAPEDVHANLWVGANKKWRAVPADRLEKARRQKDRSESELKRADERLQKKNAKRNAAIKAKGIDYEFDGYAK